MNALSMVLIAVVCGDGAARGPELKLQPNAAAENFVITIDGREALAYQHASAAALPHYWPLRSPSGKLLTVQETEPFPHHRSVWIADHVQAENAPAVDFYHCSKNYRNPQERESGYRHFIRHDRFGAVEVTGSRARVEAELRWIIDEDRPILDEHRDLLVVALGNGEYLIDLAWELRASYGPVKFVSDAVHYAWPYLRVHPQFSGDHGGAIVSDAGAAELKNTATATARWIDYSNTVDGETEGLAVMVYPDGENHQWLTRTYGTFGPRRIDRLNGTKFTLPLDERLKGRVGILVHRGNSETGRVAERYQQYIEGKW